jgi:hypothetical protein
VQLKLKCKVQAFLSLVGSIQLNHRIGTNRILTGKKYTLYRSINRLVHVGYIRSTLFHAVMHLQLYIALVLAYRMSDFILSLLGMSLFLYFQPTIT